MTEPIGEDIRQNEEQISPELLEAYGLLRKAFNNSFLKFGTYVVENPYSSKKEDLPLITEIEKKKISLERAKEGQEQDDSIIYPGEDGTYADGQIIYKLGDDQGPILKQTNFFPSKHARQADGLARKEKTERLGLGECKKITQGILTAYPERRV